jgi:hypothetical protein
MGLTHRRGLRKVIQAAPSGVEQVLRETDCGRQQVSGCHIAHEQRVRIVDLIVRSAEHLIFVNFLHRTILRFTAWTLWRRQ